MQRTNRSHKTRISTHTLTWSVTLPSFSHSFSLKNFNSHAHVERDGTHQKTIITEEDFNSHAHVERDWQMVLNVSCFCHFNSHAHVERDYPSSFALSKLSISTHTLTWSVTWSENSAVKSSYFNSHAHVERDNEYSVTMTGYDNFNSHAHVERDGGDKNV